MRSRFLNDDATDGLNSVLDDRDLLRERLDAEDRADEHAGVAPLHVPVPSPPPTERGRTE